MKWRIIFSALLVSASLYGQDMTYTISVEGRIRNQKLISFSDLSQFTIHTIDSLQIYNHAMVPKSMIRNIKGVLLKEVLKDIQFDAGTAQELSQYYLICVAKDNYKVVFSWNELFNSPTGDHVLVVTEKDGAPVTRQQEGLLLITPTDLATGRRYVKELNKIIIQKIN